MIDLSNCISILNPLVPITQFSINGYNGLINTVGCVVGCILGTIVGIFVVSLFPESVFVVVIIVGGVSTIDGCKVAIVVATLVVLVVLVVLVLGC